MFEYQMILGRTNDLMAEAEHDRLVRDVKRANKARRDGERRGGVQSRPVGRRGLRSSAR
ncbi:hypothetical protein [Streptacidiphilus jiangxiensis]|uniref:Uncharacterized protein n=1 Tax=Streptacidiphilus jiangxiensis TaxID=235985 RepID=A0A1H8A1G6_STRJI|nr:hypothetical protein [Streptacidiphilus jiangxiensis]SEM64585.1 hypothetical protein SAMN05414137_14012 [Streptacidiphilus jiangxiensis]